MIGQMFDRSGHPQARYILATSFDDSFKRAAFKSLEFSPPLLCRKMHRPIATVLALVLVSAASQSGFSVHDDLLAFPQVRSSATRRFHILTSLVRGDLFQLLHL
jgi:hypothetical protein